MFSDRRDRVLGLRVITDAETTVWFDAGRKKMQAVADAKFPGRINRVSCADVCGDDDGALVDVVLRP